MRESLTPRREGAMLEFNTGEFDRFHLRYNPNYPLRRADNEGSSPIYRQPQPDILGSNILAMIISEKFIPMLDFGFAFVMAEQARAELNLRMQTRMVLWMPAGDDGGGLRHFDLLREAFPIEGQQCIVGRIGRAA